MARFDGVIDTFWHLAREVARATGRRRRPTATKAAAPAPAPGPTAAGGYPGDYEGMPTVTYDPHPGTLPDPGEIVWVWVPYEDDPSQGKDRPALVIGEAGNELVLIALTTKHHGKPSELIAIGAGSWDPARRPSYAKIEHLLRAHPSAIRREGATIDRQRFQQVVDGASRLHPFQAR